MRPASTKRKFPREGSTRRPIASIAVFSRARSEQARVTAALTEAAKAGELKNCTVIGPLALDNAISVEAAARKGITDPNAGHADVLLVPNIETGNVFYKSMVFLAHAKNAGLIVGAKAPVIVTSRADSEQTKIDSIALALAVAAKKVDALGT